MCPCSEEEAEEAVAGADADSEAVEEVVITPLLEATVGGEGGLVVEVEDVEATPGACTSLTISQ